MQEETTPGFHGKLPGLGDFVSRRLPRSFLDIWDQWLQEAIAASRGQLADIWLETYLTSPIWRFALSPGICGSEAWSGIVMPSVDRVGRYFPLTIAVQLPEMENIFSVLQPAVHWFDEAETVLLSALEDNDFDIEHYDQRVAALGSPDLPSSIGAGVATPDELHSAWHIPLPSLDQIDGIYPQMTHNFVKQKLNAYSLWWSVGSDMVNPSLLVCEGLPPADHYSALLDGAWKDWAWQDWDDKLADLAKNEDEDFANVTV